MHVIRDRASIHQLTDIYLTTLLDERSAALLVDFPDFELNELVTFIVLDPGASLDALTPHLGFHALTNRHDGRRFGDAIFTPSFELIQEHPAYFEIVFVLSDDGYGVEVFVPKAPGINPELLAMCAAYTTPAIAAVPP